MDREYAENNAIGVLLNDNPRIIDVIENFYTRVTPECFHTEYCKLIYDVMRSLHSKGKPANIIEIAEAVNSFKIFDKDFNGTVKALEKTRDNAEFLTDNLETFCNVILDGYVKDSVISSLGIENPSDELMVR